MKIAIPVENGRLHGHFGGCRAFALVDADPGSQTVLATQTVPAPPHQPGLFPRWLREQGVTALIVGGIGRRALDVFAHHGITVRAGWPDASVEVLVAAYLDGQLTRMPEGCAHHGHHHEHHHGHDHGHGRHHHHHHPHNEDGNPQHDAPST